MEAILTFVLYSLRAAFKLSKLSDTPQEDFTCNSEINSESHIHLLERRLTRQFLSVMCTENTFQRDKIISSPSPNLLLETLKKLQLQSCRRYTLFGIVSFLKKMKQHVPVCMLNFFSSSQAQRGTRK
jgi:hypothetical protein